MGIQSDRTVIDQKTPALRLFGAEAGPRIGADYVLDFPSPGRYTIRVWSNAEWERLAESLRPATAYRDHARERWYTILGPTTEEGGAR
jgi:hypothetical protein